MHAKVTTTQTLIVQKLYVTVTLESLDVEVLESGYLLKTGDYKAMKLEFWARSTTRLAVE